MDIERFKEFDALRPDDEVRTGSVDRIQPQDADKWPKNLHPSIHAALDGIGMGKPYKHQFDAVAKSLNGADVVLESPTASGKTLAFTVPHAARAEDQSRLSRLDDLPDESLGVRPALANPAALRTLRTATRS